MQASTTHIFTQKRHMGLRIREMKEKEKLEALVTLILAELFDEEDENKNDGLEIISLLFCAQNDELFDFGDSCSLALLVALCS